MTAVFTMIEAATGRLVRPVRLEVAVTEIV